MSIHSKVLEIDRRKELTHADTDYKYEDERRRDKQPKKNVSKFNEFEEEENDMSIPDELSNGMSMLGSSPYLIYIFI